MHIILKFLALAEFLGTKEEEFDLPEGTTLSDLLFSVIPSRYPEHAQAWKELFLKIDGQDQGGSQLKTRYLILINGRQYHTLGLDYKLKEGDVVSFILPVGGG